MELLGGRCLQNRVGKGCLLGDLWIVWSSLQAVLSMSMLSKSNV